MTQHMYAVALMYTLMWGGGLGAMVCAYIIMRPIMAARKAARMERYEYQARLIRIVQSYNADIEYRKMRCKEAAERIALLERMK